MGKESRVLDSILHVFTHGVDEEIHLRLQRVANAGKQNGGMATYERHNLGGVEPKSKPQIVDFRAKGLFRAA